MYRQIVMWNFAEHVDDAGRAAINAELDALPGIYPAMRNWMRGDNVSRRDDTFAHTFVVDFGTEDELNDYLDSEHHVHFVAERWRPNVRNRVITTLHVPDET